VLKHVFRSCTDEKMPMLKERLACLREAGKVLYEVRLSVSDRWHLTPSFSLSFVHVQPDPPSSSPTV